MEKLFDPKVDFVFKLLFGDEKEKNILKGFLSAVLNIDKNEIENIEILNPITPKKYLEDKYSILDIKIKKNNDSYINVEMQIRNYEHIRNRAIYYLSKLVEEQLKESDGYEKLIKSIVIMILDFEIIDNNRIHNKYLMKEEKTNEIFSDLIELHFLEIPKLKKEIEKENEILIEWLKFLENPESEEVKMITVTNPEIDEALRKLKDISRDETQRYVYESRLMGIKDEISKLNEFYRKGINLGKEQGIQQGISQGEYKAKLETARKLKQLGIEDVKIQIATGLSIEEIEKL